MNNFLRISALLTLAALPAAAANFSINSTGGGPEGFADPNWLLNGGTAYVTIDSQYPFGPWLANSVASGWISPKPSYALSSYDDAPGFNTYSTTFDLTGLNPASASISFLVAADDALIDVLLNGVSQGIYYVGLDSFSGLFTINSDFIIGINTIEFVTENGGPPNSPSGLRIQFMESIADVPVASAPEPSSIALLGLGTILLFSRRFRSAK
jgi:hypothetical protein